MADFVRFTKKGLRTFNWDGDVKDYVQDHNDGRVPHHIINLRSRCEIDRDVTLGDIFNAVQDDEPLTDFIAKYSWCPAIRDFHKAAKLPPPPVVEGDVPIVEIVIDANAELTSQRKKGKIKPEKPMRFDGVWLHFGGIGADGISYSLSCTPMSELADVPVRLTNTCDFRKDYQPLFDLKPEYTFSLLDVLDAIYWDISFHGGPKENEEFIDSLAAMCQEIKDGTAKTVPFEFEELEIEEPVDPEDTTDNSPDLQK